MLIFISDNPIDHNSKLRPNLKLFNLGNLTNKSIIKIFSLLFPQICEIDKILDLNIEITFFEFFEAFIICVEESIRVSKEENFLQDTLSLSTIAEVPFGKNK